MVNYTEEYSLGPLVYREEKGLRSRLLCDSCGMKFKFRKMMPSGDKAERLVEMGELREWGRWRLYGEWFTVRIATYMKQKRGKGKVQEWQQTMAFFPSRLRVEPGEYLIKLKSDGSILLRHIRETARKCESDHPSPSADVAEVAQPNKPKAEIPTDR